MPKITFTNVSDIEVLEKPKPASLYVPEWYKQTESYVGSTKTPDANGNTNGTIKRCMPVFDAITSGYIIESTHDIFVDIEDGKQRVISSSLSTLGLHGIEQAPLHPLKKELPYLKWVNLWGIKTDQGYSTLFVQPFHRESPLTILPGIVDTDTYSAPVNFPFVINDPNFTGLIPAGTPIVQVIPFKRESWKSSYGAEEENKTMKNITQKLQSKFFDRYKTMFWSRKEYK